MNEENRDYNGQKLKLISKKKVGHLGKKEQLHELFGGSSHHSAFQARPRVTSFFAADRLSPSLPTTRGGAEKQIGLMKSYHHEGSVRVWWGWGEEGG